MHDSPSPSLLRCAGRDTIAYHTTDGKTPGVIFCGGFMSDMTGTKAIGRVLEEESTNGLQAGSKTVCLSWSHGPGTG